MSSDPILSALTTCGWPYGAPSTLNGSTACPCAASSSGFPFAHMHVHDDDDDDDDERLCDTWVI